MGQEGCFLRRNTSPWAGPQSCPPPTASPVAEAAALESSTCVGYQEQYQACVETQCNQLDHIFLFFFLKWLQSDMQDSARAFSSFLVSPLSTVQVSQEGSSPNRSWGYAEPRWLPLL